MALKAVVGEEALTPDDHLNLDFLERFENEFVRQGMNFNVLYRRIFFTVFRFL